MKVLRKCTFTLFIGLFLIIQFSACYSVNNNNPGADIYWYESESGSIQTNDIERLKTSLPFTVVLPLNFPDELKNDHPKCVLNPIQENKRIDLTIYYYSTNPRELEIRESYPSEPLDINFLAASSPDYSPVKIKDLQILEQQGLDYVINSNQRVLVSCSDYFWQQDKINFMVKVLGFDQVEARKIIESMIK